MELLLNLVWVAISAIALLGWASWRRISPPREGPALLRGFLVISCILFLLFPVISISDDLSQIPSLAEGNRLQDVFKSPELRGIYIASAIVPSILLTLRPESESLAHNLVTKSCLATRRVLWLPSIEKRPPPHLA